MYVFVCRQPHRQTDRQTLDCYSDLQPASGRTAIDCVPEELHCTPDPTLPGPATLPPVASHFPSTSSLPYRMCARRWMIFCWFSVLAINAQCSSSSLPASCMYGPVWCMAPGQCVHYSRSRRVVPTESKPTVGVCAAAGSVWSAAATQQCHLMSVHRRSYVPVHRFRCSNITLTVGLACFVLTSWSLAEYVTSSAYRYTWLTQSRRRLPPNLLTGGHG